MTMMFVTWVNAWVVLHLPMAAFFTTGKISKLE